MKINIYQINADRDDPEKRRIFLNIEALERIFKSKEIKSDFDNEVK